MTLKPLRAVRLIALATAIVAATGCQSAQTTAARKIAEALPRALGPADHYEVSVEGDTFALARGRANRIHIVGRSVRVAPDATLDTLDVDARGISFSSATKRFQHVDQATFTGTIGQQNINRYLAARHSDIPGLSVRLRAADVVAEIPISVVGLHTQAAVSGTLAADRKQPDHLDFVADAASVGALDIPASLVNSALDLINPVFDLSYRKVPLTITRAGVVNSQIVLQGKAQLDNFQAS